MTRKVVRRSQEPEPGHALTGATIRIGFGAYYTRTVRFKTNPNIVLGITSAPILDP